jgi:phosphoribosylamine--glycine ligase
MRFLVIGSGGRENAIVRALKFSASVTEVHACPGSEGISQEAICHQVDLSDSKAIENFVKKYSFDCVVIGPEQYLVQGLADQLRGLGVKVVGPSTLAAQLEGSKIFAKEFMVSSGVPTAKYEIVEDVLGTLKAAQKYTPPFVLKADGLAAGKGVFVCPSLGELKTAAEFLFEQKGLGQAGRKALLEEFQPGYELSYLILTNGQSGEALPISQDHKRLMDDDQGPNTGGMGVVGPIAIADELREQIQSRIVAPTLRHLQGSGLLYRGVLYIGLMITPDGPTVIEFNVRFGDPECQILMPLLEGDWGQVFARLADGELEPLRWKNLHMSCVVLASDGYPDAPVKGSVIEGDLGYQSSSSYFLHAGTAKNNLGQWTTNGGRVLNAIGLGSTLREALQMAYQQASHAAWPGLRMRKDIGAKIKNH